MSRDARVGLVLVVGALAIVPSPSQAFDSGWGLRLEAGSSFPISIGGRASLVAPYGFFATGGVGWMPSGYSSVVNEIAVASGAYSDATGDLIRESLKDSLVVDALLGWDPGEPRGVWFAASYSLITLGAGVSARSVVESVTGVTIPASVPDLSIPLASTLHLVGGTAGWTVGLGPVFEATLLLNVQVRVASTTELDIEATGPVIDAVQGAIDGYFDDAFEGLVVGSLGLYLGARF